MSLATLPGELEAELEHTLERILDRVDSLGLDALSDEVLNQIKAVFGTTVRDEFEEWVD